MAKRTPAAIPEVPRGTLDAFTPDDINANDGTERGRRMLETSIRRYGTGRSILVDKNNRVIAGNKTLARAKEAGIEEPIIVESDGTRLVVVRRTDLDLTTDLEARELGVADNQTGSVGLAWNPKNLQAMDEAGADMRQFFRPPEWDKLMTPASALTGEETIPEMEIQPFEHHDYIMVVFKDSHAWTLVCDRLGIKREGVTVGGRRKVGIGRVIPAERLIAALDAGKATK